MSCLTCKSHDPIEWLEHQFDHAWWKAEEYGDMIFGRGAFPDTSIYTKLFRPTPTEFFELKG